jgi:hypothetical protein
MARATPACSRRSASIARADANATIVTGDVNRHDAGGNVAPVTFLKQLYCERRRNARRRGRPSSYCWPAMPGIPRMERVEQ